MILIVGSGLSGATIARKFADDGYKVKVIDKRNHIGGNVYDFIDENGIRISKYGAHIFHTNHKDVWDFVNKYSDWTEYEHRVKSFVDGELLDIPVNRRTFNKLSGMTLSEKQMKNFIKHQGKVNNIGKPINSEESAIKRIGSIKIYEKMFKNYTKKQWDLWPEELEPEVMDRIPVRFDYNDRYFNDTYEALPSDGYTKFIENMLNHENIDVELNKEYTDSDGYEAIFFTGKIDSYFNDELGKLGYRSVKFEYETHNVDKYQETSVVNYPSLEYDFTRIVEYKHFYDNNSNITVIAKEYSIPDGEPYYPIPTVKNRNLYKKYQEKAKKLEKNNIYFVGRLANYKYFNMDQAIKNSLDLYNKVKEKI